ncbi:MAG: tetratricopeptide repeat protein [Acidobacteria bacterium]|nr:tetratricopeptide repeat protein [Acidobacteriota bacterium]
MGTGFVCRLVRWSAVIVNIAASGQSGALVSDPVQHWISLVESARQQRQAGAYQAAYQTLQQARMLSQRTPEAPQLKARTYEYLGSLALLLGRPIEAETNLKTAIRLWEGVGQRGFVGRLQTEADLINLYVETARPGPAARLAKGLTAECEGRLDETSPSAGRIYRALAASAYLNQDLRLAETLSRRGIRNQQSNPDTLPEEESQVHNELGLILWKQGRKDEARQEVRAAIGILEANGRIQIVEYAAALSTLALMTAGEKDPTGALDMLRRAIDVVRLTIGADHIFLAKLWSNYADLLKRARRGEESKAARREAQSIYESTLVQQPGRHSVDVADFTREARRR